MHIQSLQRRCAAGRIPEKRVRAILARNGIDGDGARAFLRSVRSAHVVGERS